MKKIQSVLCAAVLALSLSSTVLAGNIHGLTASASGNIHGLTASAPGILVSDFFTWSDITDAIVFVFGNIHG